MLGQREIGGLSSRTQVVNQCSFWNNKNYHHQKSHMAQSKDLVYWLGKKKPVANIIDIVYIVAATSIFYQSH